MKIIISPAKKMTVDTDTLVHTTLPQFLPQTRALCTRLQSMSEGELRELWRCNDGIASQNIARLRDMDLQHNLTPAILSYQGIQYQYMAPGVFENDHFSYINHRLCILSGFYGLLRPFDGVTPYRLEMQSKLLMDGHKDLYAYWGDALAKTLCNETDFILNLASKEYSRIISAHLPKQFPMQTCTFAQRRGDRLIERGTMCKMARGQMVRFLAENQITNPDDLRHFSDLGYAYAEEHSDTHHLVFVKEDI